MHGKWIVNFEPLDARPSSQCSRRTPPYLISSLIAMTQPGYISNSFNVFSAILSNFMFFFSDGRPKAEIQTAIAEALERNKSRPGIGKFSQPSVNRASSSFLFAFQCRKVKNCPTMLRTLSNHAWKQNWIKSSEDSSLGFFPKQKLLLSVFQCLHLKRGQFNSGDIHVGVEHLYRLKVPKNMSGLRIERMLPAGKHPQLSCLIFQNGIFWTCDFTIWNSCPFMSIQAFWHFNPCHVTGCWTQSAVHNAEFFVLDVVSSVALAGALFKIQDRIQDFDARSNLQVRDAMIHVRILKACR